MAQFENANANKGSVGPGDRIRISIVASPSCTNHEPSTMKLEAINKKP